MRFQQSAWFLWKSIWIFKQIVRELLLFCTSRTSAARRCAADDLLWEGRGPGARRRTTSADSLQANTLVRLFAPQGPTLFAPRFRSTQPWSYAHTPAMPAPTTQLGSSSASTRQPPSVGMRRTGLSVTVSGTTGSSPAQPAKSSLSQVSTT